MEKTTIVELGDVLGRPRFKMSLPLPLRIGDQLQLKLKLNRINKGRSEQISFFGVVRVTAVWFDVSHQFLVVDCVGKAPHWQAVKKQPPQGIKLGPARHEKVILK
jgi:hypothetical protein